MLSIRWCNLRASALPKPKRLRKAAEATSDADDAWQSVVLGWQLHDWLDDIGFMLGCSLSQYHQLDAHSCENGLYRFHVFSPCHVQIPRGRQSCRTQVLLSEHLAERTKSREQAAQYLGFANSEKVQGRDVGDNSQPWDVDIQGCLCCTLGWGKGKWSVTNHLFQSNGSNFC